MTAPPRRTGRPPLVAGETTTLVSVRVNDTAYDRLCARARRDRVTVLALMRRAVGRLLDDDDKRDDSE